MQLKINKYEETVFEWIPYNQFNEIKETGKNDSLTVYSAIWEDGPLFHMKYLQNHYVRKRCIKVALKCLHNSQASIDSLLNKTKKYPIKYKAFQVLYGISQNPDTGNYIFVQNNYMWTMLEWIPYNQFNEIKETGKNGFITVYSAIWNNGPLHYNEKYSNYTRDPNKEVSLKCLHSLKYSIDFLINEANKYSTKNESFHILYGISQNPNTNEYILVQNYSINLINWMSRNEKIDNFIQDIQLKINYYSDVIFEWIPYNQFNEIRMTGKNGSITVYSALWNDGPLHYNKKYSNYTRDSNRKVALRCLHGSKNIVEFVINAVEKYLINTFSKDNFVIYGISQNPDTNDYILVLAWTSGNEKIDDFIQEMQLLNQSDVIFEWVPYNQFNKVNEIYKNGSISIYSAIWTDGPLHYNKKYDNYARDANKEVVLRCLHDSQNIIELVINEV
uniref:Protein kinase domain-containing protein n=1 Tax=Rhizophagus irregularis (strain DAOM 181602 / DAOM 197198 / MUCL 43194) TaxID=747089 RepID=U9U9I0_RHIID